MQKPGTLANGMTFDAFGYDGSTTTGLTFGIKAGTVSNNNTYFDIAASTITLLDNAINRIVLDYNLGTIELSKDTRSKTILPLFCVHTDSGAITYWHDLRSAQNRKIASSVPNNRFGWKMMALDEEVFSYPDLIYYVPMHNRCEFQGKDRRGVRTAGPAGGAMSIHGPEEGIEILERGPGGEGIGAMLWKYGDDSSYEQCVATMAFKSFEGFNTVTNGDFGSFTICAKPSIQMDGQGFWLMALGADTVDTSQTQVWINQSQQLRFGGDSITRVDSNSAVVNYGEWNVWTVVRESAAASTYTLYHNGSSVASTTTGTADWVSGWTNFASNANYGPTTFGPANLKHNATYGNSAGYAEFDVPLGYIWMGPQMLFGENGPTTAQEVSDLYDLIVGN